VGKEARIRERRRLVHEAGESEEETSQATTEVETPATES
jgi:hypothetical protein